MAIGDVVKRTTVIDAEGTGFTVIHYADGDVMITQPGGFDGTERVFIPAAMIADFMKAVQP